MAAPAAAAVVVVTAVAGQRGWPDYSARRRYLSELGARHAPDGPAVSAGFFATGVLLLAALVGLAPARHRWPRGAWLGLVGVVGGFGTSYAVAGVARCDAGCPDSGDVSVSQQVHNVAGTVGYTAAIVGMATFGWTLRRSPHWRRLALTSLATAPTLAAIAAATPSSNNRCLLQRIVELTVFTWIIAITHHITTEPPT